MHFSLPLRSDSASKKSPHSPIKQQVLKHVMNPESPSPVRETKGSSANEYTLSSKGVKTLAQESTLTSSSLQQARQHLLNHPIKLEVYTHFLREGEVYTEGLMTFLHSLGGEGQTGSIIRAQEETFEGLERTLLLRVKNTIKNLETFLPHISCVQFQVKFSREMVRDKSARVYEYLSQAVADWRLNQCVQDYTLIQGDQDSEEYTLKAFFVIGFRSDLREVRRSNIVYRCDAGCITWLGATNCVDFLFEDDDLIKLSSNRVEVYPQSFLVKKRLHQKPRVGEYLNVPAIVTLNNIPALKQQGFQRQAVETLLQQACTRLGCDLRLYNAGEGSFTFYVPNFQTVYEFNFDELLLKLVQRQTQKEFASPLTAPAPSQQTYLTPTKVNFFDSKPLLQKAYRDQFENFLSAAPLHPCVSLTAVPKARRGEQNFKTPHKRKMIFEDYSPLMSRCQSAHSVVPESNLSREQKTQSYTLLLDLDQTLIHSTQEGSVLIRPYAREFLRNMAQYYEVHIFTASVKSYADPIIDLLDINKVVRKRYYRDHCIRIKDQFYKDLRRFNTDLKKTILLDNSEIHLRLNPYNTLLVPDWIGDNPEDSVLRDIERLLAALQKNKSDVQGTLFSYTRNYLIEQMKAYRFSQEFQKFIRCFYALEYDQIDGTVKSMSEEELRHKRRQLLGENIA